MIIHLIYTHTFVPFSYFILRGIFMSLLNMASFREYYINDERKNLWRSLDVKDINSFEKWFNLIYSKYTSSNYNFNTLNKIKLNSKRTVHESDVKDKVLLGYLSKNLLKLFNIEMTNRNNSIAVLSNIFSSNGRISIIKLDVKRFYDTIPHKGLLNVLRKNRLLTIHDLALIENYLNSSDPATTSGVHQGTELSNVLAEIYFQSFDDQIKKFSPDLIFCQRYIDDIFLVFSTVKSRVEIKYIYNNISSLI